MRIKSVGNLAIVEGGRVIDYELVGIMPSNRGYSDSLRDDVKEGLRLGWQPLGPPFFNDGILYQAMVKYDTSSES